MRDLHTLTDLQLRLLDEIWRRGEARASEVHDAVEEELGLARNTVGTILSRLEKDGVVSHRSDGREFVYRATVSRDEVRQATVRAVADTLFSGSVAGMVSHALTDSEIAPGDVERLRRLLSNTIDEGPPEDSRPPGSTGTDRGDRSVGDEP